MIELHLHRWVELNTKKFKSRKKKARRELDWSSSSEESSTESVNLNYTDNEDYSDDDHILLVTSVANLRRRENMRLKPLRTRSKKAPTFKDDDERKEKNPNFWNLDKTKDVIQEYMEKDERKIRGRDPKRKVISEEKWSEGGNWNEIIKEGEDRENFFTAQRK